MKNMKNIIILIFIFFYFINTGHAFELDETVDDEIRKNYNPSQLVNDMDISQDDNLPELPGITKYETPAKASSSPSSEAPPPKSIPYSRGSIKISSRTSFDVVSLSSISDWQKEGTVVKFKTKSPVYGKNFTIPASTIFQGEIISSHPPQITCNGGHVAIRLRSMQYKGQTVPVNAYITRANDKKIFLNNIKGHRNYLKTVWKKGNWGRVIFGRMLTLTVNLGSEGATLILSPFPFAYGTICLGLNTLTSPVCAFFSKGGHISIPSGSPFKIKLMQDVMID